MHPVTGCCTTGRGGSVGNTGGGGGGAGGGSGACGACSERKCCESFAKCVACCTTSIPRGRQAAQISPMHPAMWRKWLMQQHAAANVDQGGNNGGNVRGESFDGNNGQR